MYVHEGERGARRPGHGTERGEGHTAELVEMRIGDGGVVTATLLSLSPRCRAKRVRWPWLRGQLSFVRRWECLLLGLTLGL